MESLKDELKNKLQPLYCKMLDNKTFNNVAVTCVQWGINFPKENGLMFVGKSINGWNTNETDANALFCETNPNRMFARNNQMEWIKKLEGNNPVYNTKKSAFWRVIKQIGIKSTGKEDWYSYAAWTNLYKIAPSNGGNPDTKLRKEQLESCQKILKTEIEILKPKYIIFCTSGWEKDFLWYLNGGSTSSLQEVRWSNKYESKLYKIMNITCITSLHPQGKPEKEHIKAILQLMDSK